MSDTKLPDGETLDESGATVEEAEAPAEKQEHDDAMKDRS